MTESNRREHLAKVQAGLLDRVVKHFADVHQPVDSDWVRGRLDLMPAYTNTHHAHTAGTDRDELIWQCVAVFTCTFCYGKVK